MTTKNLYPNSVPSLDLNFAKLKRLDPRVTFTRASTGTYVGADGLIKTAGNGAARFDHNPVTGESLGLLVEEARTNLLTQSQTFSSWTQNNCSLSTNSAIAPDGTNTATKLVENSSTNYHGLSISYGWGTFVSLVLSVYVKPVERFIFCLSGYNTSADLEYVFFNLATGQVSNPAKGFIQALPNGWYRCFILTGGGGFGGPQLYLASTPVAQSYQNNAQSYAGNGASGLFIWGLQYEQGSFLTSYIPTTTATVTRAAEVATLSNTGSSIFPTSAFTTVNSPFGTAGGGTSFKLVGPTIKRTAVYAGDLLQAQINALAGVNDGFWRWRVLGASFALPNFTTNGSVTVDWGDGVVETLTTGVHTFTNGGGYHDIGFRLNSGTFFKPNINNNATYKDRVIAVGPAPASMKLNADSAFFLCTALKSFDATVDTSGTTNFFAAWYGCSSLTSFPLINTAAATSFQLAWYQCSSLTSFPLINTAAVTNLQQTWSNCSGLTSFPLINTAAATNFNGTWSGCSSLTSFPLISTAAVTNFQTAWESCSSLTSFPLVNTSSGTNFTQAWIFCTGLTSFPLINTAAGTNFSDAWYGCSSLTSFPLINTGAGTSFSRTWFGCSSLTSFPANMFNTTGTLVAGAFTTAFYGCALTATSIENILTSLVTNGQSNITLGLNGGTNANTSTWSAAAKYAYLTLIARGWTITQNGTAPTDADADSYIAAVEAADGASLETTVKAAISAFVIGCKADSTWPAIKASCILAGARTLSGALVPLAGTAPTNNNFVSGDYNRKVGLVGNRSTKYLNSNRFSDSDPQNNQHLSVFVTAPPSSSSIDVLAGTDDGLGNVQLLQVFAQLQFKCRDGGANSPASASSSLSGLVAVSRSSSADYSFRARSGAISGVFTSTSSAPSAQAINIFQRGTAQPFPTDARLAFYSIGESIDLALLDTRVSALIAAYAAAIP